jgi:transposase
LNLSNWLIAGLVPGVQRQPLKKMEPDQAGLLRLLQRWRDEAVKSGATITRIAVAFKAGRDGFWLARWLRCQEIEVQVIHSGSVAVSREHRRAKTDRFDTNLLIRVFVGWLRGERGIVAWLIYRQLKKKTRSGGTESVKVLLVSEHPWPQARAPESAAAP